LHVTNSYYFHSARGARYVPIRSERGVHDISVRSINIDDLPTDRPHSHFGEFQMAITLQQVIRSTSRMYGHYICTSHGHYNTSLFTHITGDWKLISHEEKRIREQL